VTGVKLVGETDYREIRKWFDQDKWDIGYLTKKRLEICSQRPIKYPTQPHGKNLTNQIHYDWEGICNALVLVRHSSTSLEYKLYDEATEILTQNGLKERVDWIHVYTNFKEALLQSGRGVRARNSLVYNYKFGFDSKICVIGFPEIIKNPPKRKPVKGWWAKCIGCDDCRINCPAGAIHNEGEPEDYWLDSAACDNFIGFGTHPRIPSIKTFWHKYIHPEVPKKDVDRITSLTIDFEVGGGKPYIYSNWDKNGHTTEDGIFRYKGKQVSVPHCRECQVQPRCSKWGGKFDYTQEEKRNDALFEST
jgi:ferredoxin